jgi:chromodomain-helicase-DNA-binding protein 1
LVVDHRIDDKTKGFFCYFVYIIEYSFLIKWARKSHWHNTWEPDSGIKQIKGFRKVENYKTKLRQEEQFRNQEDISKEEIEHLDIQKEMMRSNYLDYLICERVVDVRYA